MPLTTTVSSSSSSRPTFFSKYGHLVDNERVGQIRSSSYGCSGVSRVGLILSGLVSFKWVSKSRKI